MPPRGLEAQRREDDPACLLTQKPLRDALLSILCLPWAGTLPLHPPTPNCNLVSRTQRSFSNMLPRQFLPFPRLRSGHTSWL